MRVKLDQEYVLRSFGITVPKELLAGIYELHSAAQTKKLEVEHQRVLTMGAAQKAWTTLLETAQRSEGLDMKLWNAWLSSFRGSSPL
jgi:hypothetical protein